MSTYSPDVLVIGLDGGTFDVFERVFEWGWMPTFKTLCAENATSELQSTLPPITAPAWTTFRTGVNPGKHGIFGFTSPNPGGEPILNTAADIQFPRLWQVANQYGKSVGVVSLPFSYPAEPLDGVLVSGLMTSGKDESATYPESLRQEVMANTDVSFEESIADKISITTEYVERLTTLLNTKLEMDTYLLETRELDSYITVYQHLDTLQHYFYKYLSSEHPDYETEATERFRPHLQEFFTTLDGAIDQLLTYVNDETTVLFVSDHGFAPVSEVININYTLAKNGYITYRKGTSSQSLTISPRRLTGVLTKLDILNVRGRLTQRQREWVRNIVFDSTSPDIDYSATTAFFQSNNEQGIYVREEGTEREELVAELRSMLESLKHPERSDNLFSAVHRREDIYNGPYVGDAPDLLIETAPPYHTTTDTGQQSLVSKQPHGFVNGWHDRSGIFVAAGNEVDAEAEVHSPDLADLAPTILTLLNVPILKEMDGRPLAEAFDRNFEPINTIPADEVETMQREKHEYTDEVDEQIRERLGDLGYL